MTNQNIIFAPQIILVSGLNNNNNNNQSDNQPKQMPQTDEKKPLPQIVVNKTGKKP